MRPIDADRALEIVRDQGIAHPNAYHLTNYATLILREAPTIDVAPVVHGRWIMHDDEFGLTCECSACHIETMGDGNYCPNCGAKMDGGAGNGCQGKAD